MTIALAVGGWGAGAGRIALAQRVILPSPSSGAATLRPIEGGGPGRTTAAQLPGTTGPAMVPLNPATQSGIYPSTTPGTSAFDPYATTPAASVPVPAAPVYPPVAPYSPTTPATGSAPAGTVPSTGGVAPGGYPPYTGPPPVIPGAGPSATVGTFPSTGSAYGQPGTFPNSTPSALFPSPYPSTPGVGGGSPSLFGGLFSGLFGNPSGGFGGTLPPAQSGIGGVGAWNPNGALYPGTGGPPEFIRLFQGIRLRHGFVGGDTDVDALQINDTDMSATFVYPNFLYSTQPLYLMPSFSIHTWEGPRSLGGVTADLPGSAYSAFLDAGWQTDPARIFGAELGLRVGMFSDFDTAISDSLRVLGRGIGRVRLTPRSTLKLGVLYLDRNRVKLLPAGGLLWQPNTETRFDLFFPEPKLAHYLTTLGNTDMWWYVGGYYGGGSWTLRRANGLKESMDINDIRLVFGLEWGKNDQMREGRRTGFFESGFVFDRELLYRQSSADNLRLQDTFTVRIGLGY
ncbi:MAG: hypothetical protein D6753_02125 [Planctomycetota bacterium]|nr:MAG: hypothetical protein D6753_02125 [Planctomycetota bacterium]